MYNIIGNIGYNKYIFPTEKKKLNAYILNNYKNYSENNSQTI